MVADIGTRRGAKLSDISENSPWINGHEWTKYGRDKLPIKSISEIKLNKEDLKGHNDEILKLDFSDTDWLNKQLSNANLKTHSYHTLTNGEHNKVTERYRFSNYILDPNKFRYRKVIRVVALIFLFINSLKRKIRKCSTTVIADNIPDQLNFCNDKYLVTQGNTNFPFNCPKSLVIVLLNENLNIALEYFYKKATLELRHFRDQNYYKKISENKNGILYYTGRILPSQEFENTIQLSDVCIDLTLSSFCVPLIDRYSPLAFSLINEVHWYNTDAKHSGNETVMRHTQM